MSNKGARGFTLIEMVIAIVIIGVGLAGLLTAFSTVVRNSADPLIRKQVLVVAEEMMAEVLLKQYVVSGTAPGNALRNCGTAAARTLFDDVRDYHNYQTSGICDMDGLAVAGLSAYNLVITVQTESWQGIADCLKVSVTVSRGQESVTLVSWRTGYAT